jgi:hypothetical protein
MLIYYFIAFVDRYFLFEKNPTDESSFVVDETSSKNEPTNETKNDTKMKQR